MPLKFNKKTDTEHEIKLDSALISAGWKSGVARAGQPALFEVKTSFVGNGAKIKVKGKSENGKKLGKISDQIKNNSYVGKFEIPEDIELDDKVYFEVELPKNGLSGESNRIPAAPMVEVTNMKWSAEEARRGDILKLKANVSGCRNGTEAKITIYEYDADGIHDRIVEIPGEVENDKLEITWEYEYHEDVDEIPTEEELEKYGKQYNPPEYFFVIEIDGQKFGEEQESKLLTFKDWIEIALEDEEGNIIPDQKYVLKTPDGQERKGTLDSEGKAIEENVPPGKVHIEFPDLEDSATDTASDETK